MSIEIAAPVRTTRPSNSQHAVHENDAKYGALLSKVKQSPDWRREMLLEDNMLIS